MRSLDNTLVLLSIALVAPSAFAEEEDPWQPADSVHLSGDHGLTGFGSMVDGRVPSPFFAEPSASETGLGGSSTRFTVRFAGGRRTAALRGAGRLRLEERTRTLTAAYGLTVQGLDLSVTLPYRWERERVEALGGPDPGTDHDQGLGDVSAGLKVAFRVPKFFLQEWAIAALAPYVIGRAGTSQRDLRRGDALEVGGALAGPYDYSFRYVGNFALLHEEGGRSAFVYRFGVSAVPYASGGTLLRVYAHVDGVEYEGAPNSDVDLQLGAQLLLFDLLTVDLGASIRLFDAGLLPPEVQRAPGGSSLRRLHHEGGAVVTLGLGVVL